MATLRINSFLSFCERGEFDAVIAMLEKDSNTKKILLQTKDANGWNCLHWAAWHSDVECMKFLVTMDDLDVAATTGTGATAFDIALQPSRYPEHSTYYVPGPIIEMIKILLEVNCNFLQYDTAMRKSALEVAIEDHHLDVIKLLVERGSDVNRSDLFGNAILHTAASELRVDCIRFLMEDTACDPNVGGGKEWRFYCVYVRCLLGSEQMPSKEQLAIIGDIAQFTFKSTTMENSPFYWMLVECHEAKTSGCAHADMVFIEIVKALLPTHQKKHLLEKIVNTKPASFCLITMKIFETYRFNFEPDVIEDRKHCYYEYLDEMESYFLQELFLLFSVDPSLCEEFLAGVKEQVLALNELQLLSKFCLDITADTPLQQIFDFIKMLIRNDLDFFSSIEPAASTMPSHLAELICKVFVPLSNFVHVPTELVWTFGSMKTECLYNFNESENCIHDFQKLVERRANSFEVVSLKNLSRLSFRQHIFTNYDHFKALSVLYSLEIPPRIKQFLCYNFFNLKF